jgi:hypothetical protein
MGSHELAHGIPLAIALNCLNGLDLLWPDDGSLKEPKHTATLDAALNQLY